jgi:hypothetical protein
MESKDNFGNLAIHFGKHKGKMICDLPSDYLKWMIENVEEDYLSNAAESEFKFREKWGTHFYEDKVVKKEIEKPKDERVLSIVKHISNKRDSCNSQLRSIANALEKGKISVQDSDSRSLKYNALIRAYNEIETLLKVIL